MIAVNALLLNYKSVYTTGRILQSVRASLMASNDSQADLLARCALLDRRAFEELYQHASPTLYSALLRVTRNRELAADLLQEGFVKIWQHAGDYRPKHGQPLTWMGTIVRRLAIDRLRSSEYRRRVDISNEAWETLPDDTLPPEEQLHAEQGNTALTHCLNTLDPEPRCAVLLAYYEGLTHDAIARQLQRPLGTVKAWVRRSLQRLKTCLGESRL